MPQGQSLGHVSKRRCAHLNAGLAATVVSVPVTSRGLSLGLGSNCQVVT
jgi:hypothetical protein